MAYTICDDNWVVIEKTPSLNWFLNFMEDCVSEGRVDESELMQIKKRMKTDEKQTFHLVLMAGLQNDEVQLALRKKCEIFAGLTMLFYNDTGKLPKEMYWDIVSGLGLVEECFCMIVSNPHAQIMVETAAILVQKIIKDGTKLNKCGLITLLSSLSKLAGNMDEYFGCFRDLARHTMDSEDLQMTDYDKIVYIFRLLGIAILRGNDCQEDVEISSLLGEWALDSSVDRNMTDYIKIFETLFDTKVENNYNLQDCSLNKILAILEMSLPVDHLLDSDDALLTEITTAGNKKLTREAYLGGCAYLTKLIITKESANLDEYPNLNGAVSYWTTKKPKMKEEEFSFQDQDFRQFCKEMKTHADREIYQKDWLLKYLEFSSEKLIGTPEGINIAEKFIVGAESDIILQYLTKVCNVSSLDEGQKDVIFKILLADINLLKSHVELVRAVFQTGVDQKLCLENFKVELNSLLSQVGTIEFETDPKMLEKHRLSVIKICFQDPLRAITMLMEISIRTEHFRALEFADIFYKLPVLVLKHKVDNDDEEQQMVDENLKEETKNRVPDFLIIQCFHQLLRYLPDHPNSLYDSTSNGFNMLISKKIMSAVEIFSVMKYQILSMMRRSMIAISNIVGQVGLLESLTDLILEGDISENASLLNEIYLFVFRLNTFFYLYSNLSTFSYAMKIRNKLVNILSKVKTDKKGNCRDNNDATPELLDELDGITDLGFLYIREGGKAKDMVKVALLDNYCNDLSLSKALSCMLQWIMNSCENEWSNVLELLFEVIIKSSAKLTAFGKAAFLNQFLQHAFIAAEEIKIPDVFHHIVKFYGVAIAAVQESGEFGSREWAGLMDTLFSLCLFMGTPQEEKDSDYKEKKKRVKDTTGLNQVLSYLLRMVEEFVQSGLKVPTYDDLAIKLAVIPILEGKCESVRWLISERLKDLQKDN